MARRDSFGSVESFDTLAYDSAEEFMPDMLKTLLKQTKTLQTLEFLERSVSSDIKDLHKSVSSDIKDLKATVHKDQKQIHRLASRIDAIEVSLLSTAQQLEHACALLTTLVKKIGVD